MRKERVLTSYSDYSDYELATVANRILKAMQDPLNMVNFPNPTPDLERVEAVVNDYINKHLIASQRGSGVQVGEKNESRALLLLVLRDLAQYINRVAEGQISLLLSSGFDLAATPTSHQAPLTSDKVQVRDGRYSGEIRIDFTPVKTAWQYEIQIGEINSQGMIEWGETISTTNSRNNIMENRVPGLRYSVRVRASNGKGFGGWSDPVSIMAR